VAFERLQRPSWLDAKLVYERRAGALVGLECLRLPPGTVERQHQLSAETLTERMLRDELLELRNQLRVMSKREVSIYALLDANKPKFLEALRLSRDSTIVRQIAKCGATPEC